MNTFEDKAGRGWVLTLDVYLVEQIHQRTPTRIDKLVGSNSDGLAALFGDVVAFGKVLWVMVEDQAAKLKVTPEQFARGFDGDALEDAADAFVRALADFSPRHLRKTLLALVARGKELTEQKLPQVLAEIAKFDPTAPTDPTRSPPATTAEPSLDSTLLVGG